MLRTGTQLVQVTPELRAFLMEPKLLIVTKSAVRSKVHRRTHMDYIGIKRFDAAGKLVGEFRIVGLFTSTVYTRSTRTIPYLRRKVDAVIKRAGFDPDSHSGKSLANVLDTYSRDELFQIDEDTLYQFAMLILQLDERPRVRVLSRHDRFDRFVSVFVFVPRDRYNSTVRTAIGQYLAEVYQGRMSAYYPFFPEGPLVRVHFIIGRDAGETPRPAPGGAGRDRRRHHPHLDRRARPTRWRWCTTPAARASCSQRYRDAFSEGYRASYSPLVAVDDIKVIAGLSAARPLSADFHRRTETVDGGIGLKVWSFGRPIPLSERVPVLENMGFRVVDEQTHHIRLDADDRPDVWLHDMVLERAGAGEVDLLDSKQRLEACFLVVMTGGAENDGYNALVLSAGLAWRDVALIRTISRFLRQIRVPYSQDYMWAHAGAACRSWRRRSCSSSTCGSIRGSRRCRMRAARKQDEIVAGDRAGAGGGAEPRRGPHPAPLRQRGAVGAAHQLLPDRCRGPAEGADRDQVLEPQARRPAAAEAALRDLRLFAAGRGRASALRQGRARRHPLVGPAAGFPHRGPRPGEGAAGQERGDRAGRRQGRLRAEADAGRRHPRADPGRRHRRLQALHLDAARRHRQSRRRRRGAARERRAP